MTAPARRRPGTRQRGGWRLLAAMAAAAPALAVAPPVHADDSSFLTGPELAAKVLHDVVRLRSAASGEHGFGLVVAADPAWLYIATARHVIAGPAVDGAGDAAARGAPAGALEVRLCASPERPLVGEPLAALQDADADLALLRVARPPGYAPLERALADEDGPGGLAIAEPAWLLGSDDTCAPVPREGAVRALADARHRLRIDFPAVMGGSSGVPVVSGRGIVGLLERADDVTVSVHDIFDLRRRVQSALPGVGWSLAAARNIPPTDPRAAEIDLAETLNQYLFALREVHGFFLTQSRLARPTFDADVQAYNAALVRFRNARDKYDGSLARHWPARVLPAWNALRERLWQVHLTFWHLNPRMREMYEQQRTPDDVKLALQALEPALVDLQDAIAAFLRDLGNKGEPS